MAPRARPIGHWAACGAALAASACLGPADYPGVNSSQPLGDLGGASSRADDGTAQDEASTTASSGSSTTENPIPSRKDTAADSGGDTSGGETPLLLAVVGDYGTDTDKSAEVGALVASLNPDHVFTLGDNNYPIGAAATIDDHIGQYYSAFIANYQGSYGNGAAQNRFWPAPGNHDWGTPNLTPYVEYFTLPGNERYYEIDLGLVHLFAVDSDIHEPDGYTAGSLQAAWLKHALLQSTACWKLVYFHHPAYSSAQHGSDEDLQWPFEAWGADAVLAGHDHTYERLAVGGIPYFVNGLGGASTYSFHTPLPESVVRYNAEYGAMTIAATSTELAFEFINVDGERIDFHTVDKDCAR